MNERPPLLQSLRDDFVRFQSRNTVGGMHTEHSIFIPSELLKDKAEETDQFIRAAREINMRQDWSCKVTAEPITVRGIKGIEFVFEIKPDTDFVSIIEALDTKLNID